MKRRVPVAVLACAALAALPGAGRAETVSFPDSARPDAGIVRPEPAVRATGPEGADCARAARAAEQRFGIPPGLLRAIGLVESGRRDAATGRTDSWPWSVDVAGTGYAFPSAAAARQATLAFQAGGRQNIDVGCFQVNLLSHPAAFADLDQAFDPSANADYAARFLLLLKDRLGTWNAAAAAYHSADPARGMPYLSKVLAAWPDAAAAPAPPESPRVEVVYAPVPGVTVWTPGPSGSAPVTIRLAAAPPGALPNVVSPK